VETEIPARCQVEAWDPGVPGITEVFHARIVDWAYPRHVHGTWAVLIVDDGAIRYDLDTRHCGAAGRAVTILPPGVAHDGRPAPGAWGFRKREIYLPPGSCPSVWSARPSITPPSMTRRCGPPWRGCTNPWPAGRRAWTARPGSR
jgi:hypothetical protein